MASTYATLIIWPMWPVWESLSLHLPILKNAAEVWHIPTAEEALVKIYSNVDAHTPQLEKVLQESTAGNPEEKLRQMMESAEAISLLV